MDIATIRKCSVRYVKEFGCHVLPLSIEAALLFETLADESHTAHERVEAMRPHIHAKLCDDEGRPISDDEKEQIFEVIGFAGFHRLLEVMTEAAAMTEPRIDKIAGN